MTNYNTVKRYFESKLTQSPTSNCNFLYQHKDITVTETYEDKNYIGFAGVSTTTQGVCRECG